MFTCRIAEPGEILDNKHLRGLDSRCASMTPDSLQSTARLDSTRTPEQLTVRRGGLKSKTPEQMGGGGGGGKRGSSRTPERAFIGHGMGEHTPERRAEQLDTVSQTNISAGEKILSCPTSEKLLTTKPPLSPLVLK